MITVAITAEDGAPFVVRFQRKVSQDGSVTWADEEEINEIGKSQAYGIDENFRLIIEAAPIGPSREAST